MLRRFCLLVHGQWNFMLCFSLRECIEVTKSVSTKKNNKKHKNDPTQLKYYWEGREYLTKKEQATRIDG